MYRFRKKYLITGFPKNVEQLSPAKMCFSHTNKKKSLFTLNQTVLEASHFM